MALVQRGGHDMLLGLIRQPDLTWPIPILRSLGVELGFGSWMKVGDEFVFDILLEVDPQKVKQ